MDNTKKTIVLIDGDDCERDMLRLALENDKYRVEAFTGPARALETIRGIGPESLALVVAPDVMEGMNSREFTEKLGPGFDNTVIIVMSELMACDPCEAENACRCRWIKKPCGVREVLGKVIELIPDYHSGTGMNGVYY